MKVPKLGDIITVPGESSNKKGRVIYFNLPHRWFMVEYEFETLNRRAGKKPTYRECFKYLPESMLNTVGRYGAYERRK